MENLRTLNPKVLFKKHLEHTCDLYTAVRLLLEITNASEDIVSEFVGEIAAVTLDIDQNVFMALWVLLVFRKQFYGSNPVVTSIAFSTCSLCNKKKTHNHFVGVHCNLTHVFRRCSSCRGCQDLVQSCIYGYYTFTGFSQEAVRQVVKYVHYINFTAATELSEAFSCVYLAPSGGASSSSEIDDIIEDAFLQWQSVIQSVDNYSYNHLGVQNRTKNFVFSKQASKLRDSTLHGAQTLPLHEEDRGMQRHASDKRA